MARELNRVEALRAALLDARDYTLATYAHLTPAQRRVPYLPTINPPVWELAHVGGFQEFWCQRYREEEAPPPSCMPGADPLLDSAIIPHAKRWDLPELTWERAVAYLDRVLQATLQALELASPQRRYFFQLALFHEDMHREALLMTLQTLGYPAPELQRPALPRPASTPVACEVEFAGRSFRLGSTPGADFVFDNEKWAHDVKLSPFALSTTAVSNDAFLAFVEAGGYCRDEWWSPQGLRWRHETATDGPRYWRKDRGQWLARRFDRWVPLVPDEPAMHINAFEAEAYCRFVGRRLPTEAEWEFAARAGSSEGADRFPWGDAPAAEGAVNLGGAYAGTVPVAALPGSDSRSGLRQMLGNVWEWTASAFEPYPGFAADPYAEYSQPWFHDHRVLRGGCFATRPRLVHNRWRNFYKPDRGDVFAGFRTARSLDA